MRRATRINAPVTRRPSRLTGLPARLWPWALIAFLAWPLGQSVVGHFFNEWLLNSGFLVPLLIVGLMIVAIVSAFAKDIQRETPCQRLLDPRRVTTMLIPLGSLLRSSKSISRFRT